MSRRRLLAIIAISFMSLGLILGFVPRKGIVECGSVFAPNLGTAEIYDTLRGSSKRGVAECKEALSAANVWVFGPLGVGLLAGLLAIAVPGNPATTKEDDATEKEDATA